MKVLEIGVWVTVLAASVAGTFYIDASGRMEGETCPEKCVVAGHCCEGNVSACQRPSCQMGCTLAALLPSFEAWSVPYAHPSE